METGQIKTYTRATSMQRGIRRKERTEIGDEGEWEEGRKEEQEGRKLQKEDEAGS
jgi:hypothetical protein